jgi:hypothetical protein
MPNSLRLGSFLPARACAAVARLPAPAPLGFSHLFCPGTPNIALGFAPAPDLVTPTRAISVQRLCASLQAAAAAQCLTPTAARLDERVRAHWIVCNGVSGFPDLLGAQIMPDGPDHATLVLYSRSVYGHSDLGLNLARLRTWLGALNASLPMSTER